MTIPRLLVLTAHWDRFPPVHVTLAAFVGISKPEPAPARAPNQTPNQQQSNEMSELLAMLNAG
jgi:hypothetical protein